MSATTTYDTLPGSGRQVLLDAASTVGYPDVNIASTFGTVLASRIYAADLSSLQLASSGNIAFSLDDQHSLDLSLSNDTAVFESIGKPIRIESSSNAFIEVGSNISLTAPADMIVSVPSAGSIVHTVDDIQAVLSGYDANGVLRTKIHNLELPDGIDAGYSAAGALGDYQDARLYWSSNEGISVMGGRYDDAITDKSGAAVPRCVAEPAWNFSGGAVGFNFRNPSSGRSLRYHWRINNKDELELVKQVYDAAGANESVKVAAKFGLSQGKSKEFAGSGSVIYRGVSSASGAVHAAIDAFSPGPSQFTVHIACIPSNASRPTGAELASASFANKTVVPGMAAGATQAVVVGTPAHSVQAPSAAVPALSSATDSSGAASAPLAIGQDYYLLAVAEEPGKQIANLPATFVFTAG